MVEEFDAFDVMSRKLTIGLTVAQASSLLAAAKLVHEAVGDENLVAAMLAIAESIDVDRAAFQREAGIILPVVMGVH